MTQTSLLQTHKNCKGFKPKTSWSEQNQGNSRGLLPHLPAQSLTAQRDQISGTFHKQHTGETRGQPTPLCQLPLSRSLHGRDLSVKVMIQKTQNHTGDLYTNGYHMHVCM